MANAFSLTTAKRFFTYMPPHSAKYKNLQKRPILVDTACRAQGLIVNMSLSMNA